jgi:hypothetical protein
MGCRIAARPQKPDVVKARQLLAKSWTAAWQACELLVSAEMNSSDRADLEAIVADITKE